MPKHRNSASAPVVAVVAPATKQTAPKPLRPRGPRVMVARSMFSGPMPSPELVREYEQILPGAAEFFFATMDRQALHRQSLEQRVIAANIANERTGMWLAFSLAVIAIVCGTLLIHENRDPQGAEPDRGDDGVALRRVRLQPNAGAQGGAGEVTGSCRGAAISRFLSIWRRE